MLLWLSQLLLLLPASQLNRSVASPLRFFRRALGVLHDIVKSGVSE